MSKNKTQPKAKKRLSRKHSTTDSDVGYGKPPKQHQFKVGHSGNPKGRPKGSKNESTILKEIMTRKIDHRAGGRIRQIMVMEGIYLRLADDSLKGDTRSATFLFNRYGALVSGELQLGSLDADDQQVLAAFETRRTTNREDPDK
jgi:Family of unknown function (DUF5681)